MSYRLEDSFRAGASWSCSKIWEIGTHLVGIIIKKFVIMYGHMNVKFYGNNLFICE